MDANQAICFSKCIDKDLTPRILEHLYFEYAADPELNKKKYCLYANTVCKLWNRAYGEARQNLIEAGAPIRHFFDVTLKYKVDKNKFMDRGEPIYSSMPLLVNFLHTTPVNLSRLNASLCRIADADLRLITRLTALHTLELRFCELITDSGVKALTCLSSLQILDLRGCEQLTASGIQSLASLTQLQSLDFTACRKVSSASASIFETLTNLQQLALPGEASSPELVNAAAKLPKLSSFICDHMEKPGIAHISLLTNLRVLKLENTEMDRSLWRLLSSLTRLVSLNFAFLEAGEKPDFAVLSGLMDLESLNLYGGEVGNNLDRLPTTLKQLNLAGNYMSSYLDSDIAAISRLCNLETLDLTMHRKLTSNCLSYFATLTKLKTLSLPPQLKISANMTMAGKGIALDYEI